jgi:hypothetical protein
MSYYTLVPGKFREFLDAIKKVKPPEPRASQKWLESLGFKSTRHRGFINLLMQIEFLNSSRAPTQLYHDFRDVRTSKIAMAKGLKKGYSILWDTYPEPYKETSVNRVNVFIAKGMSEDIAKRAETTFEVMANARAHQYLTSSY